MGFSEGHRQSFPFDSNRNKVPRQLLTILVGRGITLNFGARDNTSWGKEDKQSFAISGASCAPRPWKLRWSRLTSLSCRCCVPEPSWSSLVPPSPRNWATAVLQCQVIGGSFSAPGIQRSPLSLLCPHMCTQFQQLCSAEQFLRCVLMFELYGWVVQGCSSWASTARQHRTAFAVSWHSLPTAGQCKSVPARLLWPGGILVQMR